MTERNDNDEITVEDAESATIDRGFDSRRLHDFDRRCGGDPPIPAADPAQILPIGARPTTASAVHRCARCSAPIGAGDDWATIRAALHAHRVGCPGPVELPPAADA